MKKIAIFMLTALLVSCSEEQIKELNKRVEEEGFPNKEVFYKGHRYLIWEHSRFLNGVAHDPDCPCHLDTLDIWVEKNDTIYRIRKK